MFYYPYKIPKVGSLTIAHIDLSKETDESIFVQLPEFDNFEGFIPKTDLGRKKKQVLKQIKTLKKQEYFPCLINSVDESMADLSIKHVDPKMITELIRRHINITKIIKLITYISKEFNLDRKELLRDSVYEFFEPLYENSIEVEDFHEIYKNMLIDPTKLLIMFNIDDEIKNNILEKLKLQIKIGDIDSYLEYNISVWNNLDSVNIIRELNQSIIDNDEKIKLEYIGAPTYKIHYVAKDSEECINKFRELKDLIVNKINEKEGLKHHFVFDMDKIELKYGDVTISYPYKVDI